MTEDGAAEEAVVITVSTRAAAGVYADRSGPIIVAALRDLGFDAADPIVVADGPEVAATLLAVIERAPAVIITTGGTGLNPGDGTPEATRPLLDKELPHLAAAIAAYGVAHGVPTSALSRGLAGVAGSSIVVNLPGSSGGAKDGMAVLGPVLPHAVSQLRGGDHAR